MNETGSSQESGESSRDESASIMNRFTAEVDYPMFVVTVAGPDGEPSGCLIGFATQCSVHPARLLVCLSEENHTYSRALQAKALGVHTLRPGQRDLAELFGGETGDEIDKFKDCRWVKGPEGVPLLEDCRSWLVGRVLKTVSLGDRTGFQLEPVASGREGEGGFMSFLSVRNLSPGHPA